MLYRLSDNSYANLAFLVLERDGSNSMDEVVSLRRVKIGDEVGGVNKTLPISSPAGSSQRAPILLFDSPSPRPSKAIGKQMITLLESPAAELKASKLEVVRANEVIVISKDKSPRSKPSQSFKHSSSSSTYRPPSLMDEVEKLSYVFTQIDPNYIYDTLVGLNLPQSDPNRLRIAAEKVHFSWP